MCNSHENQDDIKGMVLWSLQFCHLYFHAFSNSILLSVTKILLYTWRGVCDMKEIQRQLFLMKFWLITVPRPVDPMHLFHLGLALN